MHRQIIRNSLVPFVGNDYSLRKHNFIYMSPVSIAPKRKLSVISQIAAAVADVGQRQEETQQVRCGRCDNDVLNNG